MLLTGVTEQFDLTPQDCAWEDLDEPALHDLVVHVHNTVYGQLGAVMSNMVQYGQPREVVTSFLKKMARKSQLPENQVETLLHSLDLHFPVPPEPAAAPPGSSTQADEPAEQQHARLPSQPSSSSDAVDQRALDGASGDDGRAADAPCASSAGPEPEREDRLLNCEDSGNGNGKAGTEANWQSPRKDTPPPISSVSL